VANGISFKGFSVEVSIDNVVDYNVVDSNSDISVSIIVMSKDETSSIFIWEVGFDEAPS
jgi:hypothetical protein